MQQKWKIVLVSVIKLLSLFHFSKFIHQKDHFSLKITVPVNDVRPLSWPLP